MAKTSRSQRSQAYQAAGRRMRAFKKRNDDQPWTEKDVFDLGIRLGFSGARDLGREQVITEVAKSLKRRVDEVQSKLVELGFIRNRAGRGRRTEARKFL